MPKLWSLSTLSSRQQFYFLLILQTLTPFLVGLWVWWGVPQGRTAPSSSLPFPRGRFFLSPHMKWTGFSEFVLLWPFWSLATVPSGVIERLVVLPWQSIFNCSVHGGLSSEQGLVFWNLWFQALALGRSPFTGINIWGCVVAQTRSLYVIGSIPWSWWSWGVRAGLLQGSMPRTPYFCLWPNVDLLYILLSALQRSWVVSAFRSPGGIPRPCFLSPSCFIALLVGLTAGLSCGETCQICWRDSYNRLVP